jgi:hypothetical protein
MSMAFRSLHHVHHLDSKDGILPKIHCFAGQSEVLQDAKRFQTVPVITDEAEGESSERLQQ